MKKKRILIVVILILLVGFLAIPSTYSRLNIVYTKEMLISSKSYAPPMITRMKQIEENSYEISLKNDNDYEVSFACEDIHSLFLITCSDNKIPAKATKNITVELGFKEGVDKNTLTPNPSGNGYITKLGIRVLSPYYFPESNPRYVTSDDMVVEEFTITNLLAYVKTLANTDTVNIARDNTTNIRYIGENPNNYISFNGELWRILGVMDGKIKIIATTPYKEYAFYDGDATGTNTKFQDSALKTELNETFYYTMNLKYRSMIKEGKWNVGGLNTWDWQAADTAYNTEKQTTISANVGLISATDYVYATGGSNRTACIGSTHIGELSECGGENWLKQYATTSGMWTINEFTGEGGYTLVVHTDGNIAPNGIPYTSAAYPVVYLDESAGFTRGDGTISNPYRIRGNTELVESNSYTDYILNVYVGSWADANILPGFTGREITSFDKDGGALLFSNETWDIPEEYTIDQVTVYSFNNSSIPLATYYQRTWKEDNVWHARLSNYLFRRHTGDDLDYIGADALEQNDGTLRFVIIVVPKG